MNKLHKKNLTELFEIGCSLDGKERIDFLAQVRSFNEKFANELQRMLAVDPSELGLKSTSTGINKITQSVGLKIPKTIGQFSIQSILGAGGMGIVYLGKREDINQLVAVKVSNSTLPQGVRAQAITSEAKILASLQHPNIASLVDWGTFGEQGHYVAMEFVDGLSIYDYCQQQELSIISRIKLFIKVIDAIDYAHSNLVIHRDIKPANILVDDSGAPILIDFGVARLMKSENGLHQQTQGAALTPSYASPEQLRGEALGIRSDIYSLGAVLFNLLTGKQKTTGEEKQNIEKTFNQVFNESSNSKIWKTINKQKLKDIVLVINKASYQNQNLRYHNTQAFSEDLQAILDVRPIKARAPSIWYQFRKFVARNRMASSIITLALLSTIVATGFGAWQWKEAIEQKNEAIESNNDLVNYTSFLRSVLKGINTNSGGSANATIEDFLKQAVLAFIEEKDVSHYQLAWFGHLLAGIYEGRGNFKEALNLYELGLKHANNSPEPLDDIGLLIAVALLHGSDLQFNLGIKSAKQALNLINKFPETRWKRALANLALAYSYQESGQLTNSILVSNEIIDDPNSHVAHIANALLNKANSQNKLFYLDRGIKNIDNALITFIARYGKESANVAESESLLYLIQNKQNIRNFNLEIQNNLVQVHKSVFKSNDPEQALLLIKLAEIYFLKNDINHALQYLRRSKSIFKKIQSTVPIHINILNIMITKYQMLNNETNEAINTLNNIDKTIFKKLAKHDVAKFYHTKVWINIINNKYIAAEQSIVQAKQSLKNSEYIDLLAENNFRNAQLSALRKDYKSCYDNAKKATDQADSLYPETWQLPNAYRYLQDVCQQKLNGSDNKDFPYLQEVLDSPWKQETVITTRILNSQ